jgi:hypothetical protein
MKHIEQFATSRSAATLGWVTGLAIVILATTLVSGCSPSQAENAAGAPPAPEVSVAEVVVRDVAQWDELGQLRRRQGSEEGRRAVRHRPAPLPR